MKIVGLLLFHRFRFINKLFRYFYKSNKLRVLQIQKDLIHIDFFDIEKLKNKLEYFPYDYYVDNCYYGISYHLKKYACCENYIDAYIEHGIFFGGYLSIDERYNFSNSIICMGSKRVSDLTSVVNSKIHAIGPYIHYADNFMSDHDQKNLKEELGKVLLLMPSHSTSNEDSAINVDHFLIKCECVFENYDTIVVCLYWLDLTKYTKLYECRNIRVVSAGNKYDRYFLPRLKSIINLADYVVTDNVGTHVGYCVHLNKSVWVLDIPRILPDLKAPYRWFQDKDYYEKACKELSIIRSVFEKYGKKLSSCDMQLISEFWGLDAIKTPNELKCILNSKI